MKFRIQVLRVAADGVEQMKEVMEFERQELAMETPVWKPDSLTAPAASKSTK
jgi:hypothetical protein